MSSLLSKNEYIDIAAKIQFPTDPFINGKFQKSKAGRVMESINPEKSLDRGFRAVEVQSCRSAQHILSSPRSR